MGRFSKSKMIRIILLFVVGSVISAPNYEYDSRSYDYDTYNYNYNYNDISQTTTTKAPTTTKATTQAATTKAPTTGSCKCGVKKSSNRIVNGVEAKVNEFPWIGNMWLLDGGESNSMCGGTLIAAEWMVTAAHCLYKDSDFKQPYAPKETAWMLGEHDTMSNKESTVGEKRFGVSKIIIHPKWNSFTTKNDIALMKLSEKADLSKYTPACLANTGDSFVGKTAWVYGWGQASFTSNQAQTKLQKLQLKVSSNKECTAWSNKNTMNWDLGPGQVCAGAGTGKDACKGDSGGPLTTEVNGRHVLIGDVSFGNACKGPYAIFGSIAYYRKWIEETMKANGGATRCA